MGVGKTAQERLEFVRHFKRKTVGRTTPVQPTATLWAPCLGPFLFFIDGLFSQLLWSFSYTVCIEVSFIETPLP